MDKTELSVAFNCPQGNWSTGVDYNNYRPGSRSVGNDLGSPEARVRWAWPMTLVQGAIRIITRKTPLYARFLGEKMKRINSAWHWCHVLRDRNIDGPQIMTLPLKRKTARNTRPMAIQGEEVGVSQKHLHLRWEPGRDALNEFKRYVADKGEGSHTVPYSWD